MAWWPMSIARGAYSERDLRQRVEACEDETFNALLPYYRAEHRRLVESLASVLRQAAERMSELQQLQDVVDGRISLPGYAWPDLLTSDRPGHVRYETKLSRWLREAREAGYDV